MTQMLARLRDGEQGLGRQRTSQCTRKEREDRKKKRAPSRCFFFFDIGSYAKARMSNVSVQARAHTHTHTRTAQDKTGACQERYRENKEKLGCDMLHSAGKLETSPQTNEAQIPGSLHSPPRRPSGAYQAYPWEVVVYT